MNPARTDGRSSHAHRSVTRVTVQLRPSRYLYSPLLRLLFPVVCILIFLQFLWGCRGPSESSRVTSASSEFVSTDGNLRYRSLPGWFRADADSTNGRHAIWLVRNDYAASLVVERLHLDTAAMREVRRNGLEPLVALLVPLVTGEKAAPLRGRPKPFRVGEGKAWLCEFMTGTEGETLRVTILDAGGTLYAVRLLSSAGAGKTAKQNDLVRDEQFFLSGLRW